MDDARERHPDSADLDDLLVSDDPQDRAHADAALARMGPEIAFQYLQNALWAEEEAAAGRVTRAWLVAQVVVPALLFFVILNGVPVPIPLAFLAALIAPLAIGANVDGGRVSRRERALWERLCASSDVRATRPLLRARDRLKTGDPLRARTEAALIRLLPRLTPETAQALSAQCDHVWCRIGTMVRSAAAGERTGESPEVLQAMLRALGNARPPVARFALTEAARQTGDCSPDIEALRQMARNYLLAWDAAAATEEEPEAAEDTVAGEGARWEDAERREMSAAVRLRAGL